MSASGFHYLGKLYWIPEVFIGMRLRNWVGQTRADKDQASKEDSPVQLFAHSSRIGSGLCS